MEDTFIIDSIKTAFDLEIDNYIEKSNNAIIVYLNDDTKAKVTTKNVA